MGQWGRRTQQITILREALKNSPTDLPRANRYWLALAGDRTKNETDLRSGSNVIEAYRAVALSQGTACEPWYVLRDLFQMCGEVPRPAYFDHQLVMALKAGLAELSGSESSGLEWLLCSIGVPESRQ